LKKTKNIFKDNKILIIGDLMLDTYLFGDVDRVSPEAPVPVVNITNKKTKLGGASNVALNIKQLGSKPIVCSVIGNDDNGVKMKEIMEFEGIKTDYILFSDDRITTNKTRVLGNKYQITRFDEETTVDLSYYDFLNLSRTLENIIEKEDIDVILIQDYDKGVIGEKIINKIIGLSNNNIPIIVDPKKRNFSFYKNIKMIKPNLKELIEGLNLDSNLERNEILKLGTIELHKRGIDVAFITLSEDGVFVSYDGGRKTKIVPGVKRLVSDVSGAGDTVISIISTLINKDISVDKIAEISNAGGGIVCEYVGVVPINVEMLMEEI